MPLNWIAGYVLCAGSDIVMIEYKSGRACKAVSYIYGTIMSRLPKSYKCVDAIQWDKPLPSSRMSIWDCIYSKDGGEHTDNHLAEAWWGIHRCLWQIQSHSGNETASRWSDGGNSLLAFHKCPCQCSLLCPQPHQVSAVLSWKLVIA